MFYFEKINGKKILKSDLLKNLNHFFTTKESFIRTQEKEFLPVIKKNREDICNHLNINEKDLISPVQTHSANIQITAGDSDYPDTDALILKDTNKAIFLNFADCTPVILYDKVQNIAAVAHAGWKGTAQKIVPLTVKKLQHEFDSKPENIIAVIGPAIGVECYDIGIEVYKQLECTVRDKKNLFKFENDKVYADLKAINARQLEESGVSQIDICPYCTYCDNDLFFSYRKENGTSNRHSAVVKL